MPASPNFVLRPDYLLAGTLAPAATQAFATGIEPTLVAILSPAKRGDLTVFYRAADVNS